MRVQPKVPRPEQQPSRPLTQKSEPRGFNNEPWLKQRLLAELFKVPGRIVSYDELIEAAYGDDPEGGPDDPRKCIQITLDKMRRNGLRLVTYKGRGRALAG